MGRLSDPVANRPMSTSTMNSAVSGPTTRRAAADGAARSIAPASRRPPRHPHVTTNWASARHLADGNAYVVSVILFAAMIAIDVTP